MNIEFLLDVSFHPGELNCGHLVLDGINTPVRQELDSDQVTTGATFSKLLSHTKPTGLLVDCGSDWPRGRQS